MLETDMDEGTFAADFVAANLEKILELGKAAYGKIDAKLQVSLKTAYTDYLAASRLKYSKSKSFFIQNQPVELYSYYVPTGIYCNHTIIETPNFLNCLEFTNRVVISGSGGSGKSVLMKHLFLDCIQQKAYAPILIELRDLNSNDKTLDEFISETLSNFGFKTTDAYTNYAKESGHFCYFFDGIDEVTPKQRKKVINQITSLSKKYQKCPIFLSSRPDDAISGLDDFSVFRMRPLELDEALELVSKLPADEAIKNRFCSDLSSGLFEKHQSFLSNPLLLSIMLLTYGENAEIPSKLSIFYNQAYDALFRRHDAYKGAFSRNRLTALDSQDFSKVFSLFCVQTYNKRLFKMPRSICLEYIQKSIRVLNMNVNAEDYLSDLLSAVCLMIEDGLEITFTHRSFQEYFVALHISSASPDDQVRFVDIFWINLDSDNVMHLLREINTDLFERVLLIPKLDKLFSELKVKKTVGITHFLRYLKLFYSKIDFDHNEDRGMMFTYVRANSNLRICQNILLRIIANDYSKYIKPSIDIIEENSSRLYEKYFKQGEEYLIEDLSIRSPLIGDLNINESWHSTNYLSCAYDAYKKLKLKHSNTPQSFDILLGIK